MFSTSMHWSVLSTQQTLVWSDSLLPSPVLPQPAAAPYMYVSSWLMDVESLGASSWFSFPACKFSDRDILGLVRRISISGNLPLLI